MGTGEMCRGSLAIAIVFAGCGWDLPAIVPRSRARQGVAGACRAPGARHFSFPPRSCRGDAADGRLRGSGPPPDGGSYGEEGPSASQRPKCPSETEPLSAESFGFLRR